MDNISPITRIACPGEELAANEPELEPETRPQPKPKDVRPVQQPEDAKVAVIEPEEIIVRKKEKKITTELNSDKITMGQTIQINKLYFQADTSSINEDSYAALDEVYDFLNENPNVRIEVGGHTNGIPEDEYCDKLSNARAQAVAAYLIRKGISPSRLEYKGYGKRKPIASNNTKEGRRRNQRVEIKILNVN
jgi:outer membrane protein OmpA-like peptidoglycan-associated protein